MPRIAKARKEVILNKMLSPYPPTISALSKQEGISEASLYNWLSQLRKVKWTHKSGQKFKLGPV